MDLEAFVQKLLKRLIQLELRVCQLEGTKFEYKGELE